MIGKRGVVAFLVLSLGLLVPMRASAGLLFGRHKDPDCPPPSYCCLHYWTPWVYRAKYHFHTPQVSVYARPHDLPGEPKDEFFKFTCPAVPPGAIPYHNTDPNKYDAERAADAAKEKKKEPEKKVPK
jgi:hypothetical protein